MSNIPNGIGVELENLEKSLQRIYDLYFKCNPDNHSVTLEAAVKWFTMNTNNPFIPSPIKPIIGRVELPERVVDYHNPLKAIERVEWEVLDNPIRVRMTKGNAVFGMPDEVLDILKSKLKEKP